MFFQSVKNPNSMESVEQHAAFKKQHDQYQINSDYPIMLGLMNQMHA
ncbi:hypothetical protein [Methylotuvimicrobium sp. KM1]